MPASHIRQKRADVGHPLSYSSTAKGKSKSKGKGKSKSKSKGKSKSKSNGKVNNPTLAKRRRTWGTRQEQRARVREGY